MRKHHIFIKGAPLRHTLLAVALLLGLSGCQASANTAKQPLHGALGKPATATQADPNLFIDESWYANSLVDAVDRWNGGLDGKQGTQAYRSDFNGIFLTDVARDWKSLKKGPQTAVSQSRGIFIQTQALYALGERADAAEGERFKITLKKGLRALTHCFYDRQLGGYFWMIAPNGSVIDTDKQDYGNVHPLFALAKASIALKDKSVLAAALDQFDTVSEHFIDPAYPGSIRPKMYNDFTPLEPPATNNVDSTLHGFEALQAYYEALAAYQADLKAGRDWVNDLLTDEQRFVMKASRLSADKLPAEIAAARKRVTDSGNFLALTLPRPEQGHPDRLWISYNFDENWKPATADYSYSTQWSTARHASPGHGIELAYLLSRAVERGFPQRWLTVSDSLLNFCFAHAMENSVNAMRYDISEWNGQRLSGYRQDGMFEWWPQAETARACMHFSVVRNRDDLRPRFKKTEAFIRQFLIDQKYGGWYKTLQESDVGFSPVPGPKGSFWKNGYHAAMFYSEAIRLSREYIDKKAAK
jgi:mannobiose 2-epimerase